MTPASLSWLCSSSTVIGSQGSGGSPVDDLPMIVVTAVDRDLPGLGAAETARLATVDSSGRVEWWVLEHAGPVLDQLDATVEGAVLDHLEGDVRIAVVDPF